METLGGFPCLPATLRCRHSQRSVGFARVLDGNPGRVSMPSRDAALPA
jgi:hypothetical protein